MGKRNKGKRGGHYTGNRAGTTNTTTKEATVETTEQHRINPPENGGSTVIDGTVVPGPEKTGKAPLTVAPFTDSSLLIYLDRAGVNGATWKEVSSHFDRGHGQVSGLLSRLHKEGRIARLVETRDKSAVYVTPEMIDGRPTKAQGRGPKKATCPHCHTVFTVE